MTFKAVDPTRASEKSGDNGYVAFNQINGMLSALFSGEGVPTYTVAALPSAAAGTIAYASNGRKTGEGGGAGTGTLVYRDASAWRRVSDDTTVAA